jgi:hypothetical protein
MRGIFCSSLIRTDTTAMDPIPLPSHIHYELLLQLLERQTVAAVGQASPMQDQLHELIVTLRKARAQQKHLEESCQRSNVPVEYHWSLNTPVAPEVTTPSD